MSHTEPTPQRWAFARLVGSEARLVFGRRRNIALLAGIAAVPVVIGLAVYFFGSGPSSHSSGTFLDQITNNGMFLVLASLFLSQPFLIPLVCGVVAGDSVAGEAQSGTLRYLLTVPLSRTRLLAVKALILMAFIAAAVFIMLIVGLIAGGLFFGLQDMTLLSGDTVPIANGIARVAGAALYVALSFSGLLAVGLFVSTLTEVPIAAMAVTVIVAVVSTVLDALPQLSAIHPGLLTDHWMDFMEFLRLQVDFSVLTPGLLVQLAWVVIFGSLAWARFTTADITS